MGKPNITLNISVDCVVFGYDKTTKSLNVLLIKRYLESSESKEVLVDDYVLTGYLIYETETLDECATRVLKELTGLTGLYKKQFKAFGDPNRLMDAKNLPWIESEGFNLRTVTIAYYFLLKTEDVDLANNTHEAKWFPVHDLPEFVYFNFDFVIGLPESLI